MLALVEGPTLADRIDAGALVQDEALRVAKQIIDALEYARIRDHRPRLGRHARRPAVPDQHEDRRDDRRARRGGAQ